MKYMLDETKTADSIAIDSNNFNLKRSFDDLMHSILTISVGLM